MSTPVLLSLALLKANWDLQQKDYLDNFVPLVAECIRLAEHDAVVANDLQAQLRTRFGINLPQNVLNTLLRRVAKRGYLRLEHNIYYRDAASLSNLNFQSRQSQVIRMYEELTRSFQLYCSEVLDTSLSFTDAEAFIDKYLQDSLLILLASTSERDLLHSAPPEPTSQHYNVVSFINYLQESHRTELTYFETIVQGNMLGNAIFLPDPLNAQRKFRRTDVYFDTALIIFALGHAGDPRREPARELLELLYETDANLLCFRHTVDEIRGILHACADRIRQGNIRDAWGPSIEYFIECGFKPSDIELFIAQLEQDISALRIKIREKPEYTSRYVIDEAKLGASLNGAIGYRNPIALSRDVDSISGIMRLRRMRARHLLEDSNAIFVTRNSRLVRVAKEFCYGDEEAVIGPCMTDWSLTNVLWLKRPLAAPELPRKRIIADVYAAIQPTPQLMQRYFDEIKKLHERGRISLDDYYALRYSLENKKALMDVTHGDEEALTEASIEEIRILVRQRIGAEAQAEVEAERVRRVAAEAEAESARGATEAAREQVREVERAASQRELAISEAVERRMRERRERLALRATSWARAVAQVGKVLAGGLLLIGVAFTLPWDLPKLDEAWWRYTIWGLMFIVFLLTVGNLMFGVTVESYVRRIEIRLARALEDYLRRLAEA